MNGSVIILSIFICVLTMSTNKLKGQTWWLENQYSLNFLPEGKYSLCQDSLISFYQTDTIVTISDIRQDESIFDALSSSLDLKQGTSIWLKCRIGNGTFEREKFLIEADVPEQEWDKIEIFIFDGDSLLKSVTTGLDILPAQRIIRNKRNFLWLDLSPKQEVTCYIKYSNSVTGKKSFPKLLSVDRKSLQEFEGFTFSGFKIDDNNLFQELKYHAYARYSFEYVWDDPKPRTFEDIQKNWDNLAFYASLNQNKNARKVPFWARLKIHNKLDSPTNFFMVLQGSSPKVEVFYPSWDGTYKQDLTGKQIPDSLKNIPYHFNLIEILARPMDTLEIFMRYKPTGSNNYIISSGFGKGVVFLDKNEFLGKVKSLGLWKGFFLGVFIFQFIYFALRSVLEKDRLGYYYSCILIGMILTFIYLENLSNTYLAWQIFPQHNLIFRSFGYSIGCIGFYLFTKEYLALGKYFPKFLMLLKVSLICTIISYLLLYIQEISVFREDKFFLNLFFIESIALICIGVYFFLYLIIAITCYVKKIPYGTIFLIAFTPVFLVVPIPAFQPILGEFIEIWQLNTMYVGFILSNVLFAIIVAQRKKEMIVKEVQAKNLIKLNETKSSFYDNITHEFRTPLTVIKGMTNMIKGHEKEKELIQRNNQVLLDLVDHLMGFSKAQLMAKSNKWVVDNIVPFLDYLLDTFQPLAKDKSVELVSLYSHEEIIVRFDREKIKLIVNNLISNALKFTPKKGKVSLNVILLSDTIELSVADTGIGLTEGQQAKVFEKYYQVNPEEENRPKVGGLGLAVTKEQIESLGGKISVNSQIGLGTTFHVSIPISEDKNKNDIKVKTEFEFYEKDKLVLLVEDSSDVTFYLQKLLNDGYKVVSTKNGKEGFNKAISLIPDIIISDVMMPEMDGYQLTNELKSDLRTSHIPIILLTAKSKHKDKLQGYEGGADAYMIKPFEEEELMLRIKKLIEGRGRLKELFSSDNNVTSQKNVLDPFIEKALGLLENHFADDTFGIDAFTEGLNLSRMQVHRKLKALTDLSTSQFINIFRLRKGKGFLTNNSLNISEVAYACGYSDPGYFGKLFTKHYGQSPQEYRSSITR